MPILFHQEGYGLLFVLSSTLAQMGLKEGQSVSPAQAHEVIMLNAGALLPNMKRRREAGEKGIPDPTELEKLLNC